MFKQTLKRKNKKGLFIFLCSVSETNNYSKVLELTPVENFILTQNEC